MREDPSTFHSLVSMETGFLFSSSFSFLFFRVSSPFSNLPFKMEEEGAHGDPVHRLDPRNDEADCGSKYDVISSREPRSTFPRDGVVGGGGRGDGGNEGWIARFVES